MSPESLHTLLTLAFGFSVAGMLASFYQLVTTRPASFRLLGQARALAIAFLPFLMFTAPFIIMRNIIRGQHLDGRSFGFTTLATVIAGFWSLMSGTLLVRAFETVGLFAA